MNRLLAKEVRLILPTFGAALLLAIVPAWLLPSQPKTAADAVYASLYPFGAGAVLLAVACFGREASLNTLGLLMAQPISRVRMWWVKVGVLGPAVVLMFAAWWISCVLNLQYNQQDIEWTGPATVGAVTSLAALSGGLWTTVLLRQLIAPFWFTILLPATLVMLLGAFDAGHAVTIASLLIYSIGGICFANHLFLRSEETKWTGGTISLPGWMSLPAKTGVIVRRRKPWLALLRKEFQLHLLLLLAMWGLFALHLALLVFKKLGDSTTSRAAYYLSELCSLLWFVVPLLAGATSVADERNLGTMEGSLCQPVSTRVQFAIKLLVTVLVGGVLGGALLWTRAWAGHTIPGPHDFGDWVYLEGRFVGLLFISLIFSLIALLAIYASTLSKHLLQAIVTGIAVIILLVCLQVAVQSFNLSGRMRLLPWRGWLVYLIGDPALLAAVLWLGYRNYRQLAEPWRIWHRNLLGMAATLLFIGMATAAIYNRVWEFLSPLEPLHAPAQLATRDTRLVTGVYDAGSLSALLPDGRLWQTRIGYQPKGNLLIKILGDQNEYSGGKWGSTAGNHFVDGSDWVDVTFAKGRPVAIRSDGTLWISDRPRLSYSRTNTLLPDTLDTLIQVGIDTNWNSAATFSSQGYVVVLKRDGSMWQFSPPQPGAYSVTQVSPPVRLGKESDWVQTIAVGGDSGWGDPRLYAWKLSGECWQFPTVYSYQPWKTNYAGTQVGAGVWIERRKSLDNTRWRCMSEWAPTWSPSQVGVREDGTLWLWRIWPNPGYVSARSELDGQIQVGTANDWVSVATTSRTLVGLKKDGTLWIWSEANVDRRADWWQPGEPARLGINKDWVAVSAESWPARGFVTLAADGSLWWWEDPDIEQAEWRTFTMPSRKPIKLGNIFDR